MFSLTFDAESVSFVVAEAQHIVVGTYVITRIYGKPKPMAEKGPRLKFSRLNRGF